jgi:hypothetical protein
MGAALLALLVFMPPATALFEARAQAQIVTVPPGNRNAVQPEIPSGSVSRTRATNGSFQGKYEKIRDLIAGNSDLKARIKASATRFGIEPVHIVGALVGEHTYNVDALDFLQSYIVKAANYLKAGIEFAYEGEQVTEFVRRPQFAPCAKFTDSYRLWACREDVWKSRFAGKTVDGKSWPADRFGRVFFQPLYAGQTFGLGQLNPLAALSVTDYVHRVTGAPLLDAGKPGKVYETIMDPDSTLDYMAALIRLSIDSYRSIAGFDISGNPGITATLYNLGDVIERAEAARAKRVSEPGSLPQENYYGWLVNDKLAELQALIR